MNVSKTPTGLKIASDHGSLCLSSDGGKLFLHDLEGDGENPTTLLELWSAAQSLAKKLGFKELFAHIDVDQERLFSVYTKRGGMKPQSILLHKDLD